MTKKVKENYSERIKEVIKPENIKQDKKSKDKENNKTNVTYEFEYEKNNEDD